MASAGSAFDIPAGPKSESASADAPATAVARSAAKPRLMRMTSFKDGSLLSSTMHKLRKAASQASASLSAHNPTSAATTKSRSVGRKNRSNNTHILMKDDDSYDSTPDYHDVFSSSSCASSSPEFGEGDDVCSDDRSTDSDLESYQDSIASSTYNNNDNNNNHHWDNCPGQNTTFEASYAVPSSCIPPDNADMRSSASSNAVDTATTTASTFKTSKVKARKLMGKIWNGATSGSGAAPNKKADAASTNAQTSALQSTLDSALRTAQLTKLPVQEDGPNGTAIRTTDNIQCCNRNNARMLTSVYNACYPDNEPTPNCDRFTVPKYVDVQMETSSSHSDRSSTPSSHPLRLSRHRQRRRPNHCQRRPMRTQSCSFSETFEEEKRSPMYRNSVVQLDANGCKRSSVDNQGRRFDRNQPPSHEHSPPTNSAETPLTAEENCEGNIAASGLSASDYHVGTHPMQRLVSSRRNRSLERSTRARSGSVHMSNRRRRPSQGDNSGSIENAHLRPSGASIEDGYAGTAKTNVPQRSMSTTDAEPLQRRLSCSTWTEPSSRERRDRSEYQHESRPRLHPHRHLHQLRRQRSTGRFQQVRRTRSAETAELRRRMQLADPDLNVDRDDGTEQDQPNGNVDDTDVRYRTDEHLYRQTQRRVRSGDSVLHQMSRAATMLGSSSTPNRLHSAQSRIRSGKHESRRPRRRRSEASNTRSKSASSAASVSLTKKTYDRCLDCDGCGSGHGNSDGTVEPAVDGADTYMESPDCSESGGFVLRQPSVDDDVPVCLHRRGYGGDGKKQRKEVQAESGQESETNGAHGLKPLHDDRNECYNVDGKSAAANLDLASATETEWTSAAAERRILSVVNEERQKCDLTPLRYIPRIASDARQHIRRLLEHRRGIDEDDETAGGRTLSRTLLRSIYKTFVLRDSSIEALCEQVSRLLISSGSTSIAESTKTAAVDAQACILDPSIEECGIFVTECQRSRQDPSTDTATATATVDSNGGAERRCVYACISLRETFETVCMF